MLWAGAKAGLALTFAEVVSSQGDHWPPAAAKGSFPQPRKPSPAALGGLPAVGTGERPTAMSGRAAGSGRRTERHGNRLGGSMT